jgi:hypothetical protein
MSDHDKESIKIYMRYHVSELKNLGSEVSDRWYEGQKLYNDNGL